MSKHYDLNNPMGWKTPTVTSIRFTSAEAKGLTLNDLYHSGVAKLLLERTGPLTADKDKRRIEKEIKALGLEQVIRLAYGEDALKKAKAGPAAPATSPAPNPPPPAREPPATDIPNLNASYWEAYKNGQTYGLSLEEWNRQKLR